MKNKTFELHKMKNTFEILRKKKGFHTELISLYIPSERRISFIVNYLKNEISKSKNIKTTLTKKNVLESISKLLGQLKKITKIPENGLVMFSGAIAQNGIPGTEKNEIYIIDPPWKINTFKYLCSNEFYLDPLIKSLEPKEVYGLLTIEAGIAGIALLKGNHIEKIEEYTRPVDSKRAAGGQSAPRFARLRQEQITAFIRGASEHINKIFLEHNISGIFIGGGGPTKLRFVNDNSLDYRLRDKILSIEDIENHGFMGMKDLVRKIESKIIDTKFIKEKQIFDNFMKEATKDKGLASYGLEEIEQALNYGSLDTLILSEKLDYDEIQRLGMLAESIGAKIEILSNKTESGNMLYEGFGGIAGILRFRHQRLN